MSPIFLSSLGANLLAGSLDVIHHYVDKIPGSSGTVKAKYLGAFLYMGGYLILVKVGKSKMYEPRHWFSLADFELVDVAEEEGMYLQMLYPFTLFTALIIQRYYPVLCGYLPRDIITIWRRLVNERRIYG